MNDNDYGQEIASFSTGLSTFLVKYFLILVSVAIIVWSIWWIYYAGIQFIYYDGRAIDLLYGIFIMIVGVIFTLIFFFLKRGRKITIFEYGAIISYGIFRKLSFHFEGTKAIKTGRIYFHKKRFHRRSISMLLSKKADEALQEAFCRYLVKDLTRENLKEANIYFSKRLWLKDGIFYDKRPFRAVKTLPLSEVDKVVKMECVNNYVIRIYSSKDPTFSLADKIEYVSNQLALFWVVDILHGRKPRESINIIHHDNVNYIEMLSCHDEMQNEDNQRTDIEDIKNRITDIYKQTDIGRLYIYDDIPPKKLKNAKKHYLPIFKNNEIVIFLYDGSLFGSGSDGFVLTTRCLYYHGITLISGFIEVTNVLLPLQHNKGYDHITVETKAQENIEIAIGLKKEQFMALFETLETTIGLLNDSERMQQRNLLTSNIEEMEIQS